jgi:hypothetical protein
MNLLPKTIAVALMIFVVTKTQAQTNQAHFDQQLYNTILHADSVCFDAFNRQDLETMKKVFASDVEFYNDNGTITNYDETIKAFAAMFAQAKLTGLKRELIKSSMEVYPLRNFGAIQVGVHKFTHIENGKEIVGLLKFTEVWRNNNGTWQLTRVISYNH